MSWLFGSQAQIALAWTQFVGSVIGWPVSLWLFPEEPPIVMSLSWLALILTAHNTIITARMNRAVGK